jgi:hypothetical protein
MKKDARLTIRIPKQLKDRLVGIERVYGVGLPKIANECLAAFCKYVAQKQQTPTFPILIRPTHATMERQLKLFTENLPLSTSMNEPEAKYPAKKGKRPPSSRLRSRPPRISKSRRQRI